MKSTRVVRVGSLGVFKKVVTDYTHGFPMGKIMVTLSEFLSKLALLSIVNGLVRMSFFSFQLSHRAALHHSTLPKLKKSEKKKKRLKRMETLEQLNFSKTDMSHPMTIFSDGSSNVDEIFK